MVINFFCFFFHVHTRVDLGAFMCINLIKIFQLNTGSTFLRFVFTTADIILRIIISITDSIVEYIKKKKIFVLHDCDRLRFIFLITGNYRHNLLLLMLTSTTCGRFDSRFSRRQTLRINFVMLPIPKLWLCRKKTICILKYYFFFLLRCIIVIRRSRYDGGTVYFFIHRTISKNFVNGRFSC